MQNKRFNFGPLALTNVLTTNILNCNITSVAGPVGFTMSQPYIILSHIRITNKTGVAATFSCWKGATGGNVAGTEILGTAQSVAANASYDYYGQLRMDAADFLVGGASAATTLTISGEGEIGVSG